MTPRRALDRGYGPTHVAGVLVGLSATWLAASSAPALAQGNASIELIWAAPPGCPMREQVLAKARQLVQDQGVRSVSAEGTVQNHPNGFELVLRAQVQGVELSRRLVASRCDELADAAALILAMAARPQAEDALGTGASDQTSGPSAASARARARPAKATLTRAAQPSRKVVASRPASAERPPPARQYIAATGAVDTGTLPSATLVLGGSVSVWRGPFGAEGQVRHWLSRQRDTSTPGKGGELWLTAGTFQGCLAGPLGTTACGGLEVGSLAGRGYGADAWQTRSVIWAAGVLSGRLTLVRTRWLWLAASVEGALPIKRYEFVLDGVGSIYRPTEVCLRAGVQAGVAFGSRK